MQIEIDASDLFKTMDRMAGAAERALVPIFEVMAQDLVAGVVDRFESKGDGSWPPLAASTVAKRRKGSSLPLQDTGRLKGSIHGESGPDFAAATTNTSYVVFHLEGGAIIPKRNPFELGAAAINQIIEDAVDDIHRAVEGHA